MEQVCRAGGTICSSSDYCRWSAAYLQLPPAAGQTRQGQSTRSGSPTPHPPLSLPSVVPSAVIQSPRRTCKQAGGEWQQLATAPADACRRISAPQPTTRPSRQLPLACCHCSSAQQGSLTHQPDGVCHEVVCHVSILLAHHVHVACTHMHAGQTDAVHAEAGRKRRQHAGTMRRYQAVCRLQKWFRKLACKQAAAPQHPECGCSTHPER